MKVNLRYTNRFSSTYCFTQLSWERRTLSSIALFVTYHLMACYNLSENDRDGVFHVLQRHKTTSTCVLVLSLRKNMSSEINHES